MTSVALLIACVPEGLPLAIAIATALSSDVLVEQNLLIKNLSALEKAGILTDVVTSKTNTLTEGKLNVSALYCASEAREEDPNHPHISNDVQETLESCVLLCNDAYVEIDEHELSYVPEGNSIDKCMLNWLNTIGVCVYDKIVQKQRDY